MTDPGVTPSVADIETELRRLATEFPTAIYRAPDDGETSEAPCSYLEGTAGPGHGCIFGQALKNLGVSTKFLADSEGQAITSLVRSWLPNAPHAWDDVQSQQDLGEPWAVAVESL